MKKGFPFPLPESALAEFCHPDERHTLARPMRAGREILAGNGYMAIRCRKGNWIDREFPEADRYFLERFDKLPWHRFAELTASDAWDALDTVRGPMSRHGALAVWNGTKTQACPIWRVRDHVVRLSFLQLVARLPRAEVFTGPASRADGMFFRFSGGVGIVANDARLTHGTFEIFQPSADVFDSGRLIERNRTARPVRLTQPGVNWPPVDLTDAEEGNGATHFID